MTSPQPPWTPSDAVGAALHVLRMSGSFYCRSRLRAPWGALSRSTFAARFTALVGEPVMAYVTRWRMLVAHDRLRAGGTTVAAVAAATGYRSEAAFSRAFRRTVGVAPGAVRTRAAEEPTLLGA